jgi:hypothetical protein
LIQHLNYLKHIYIPINGGMDIREALEKKMVLLSHGTNMTDPTFLELIPDISE